MLKQAILTGMASLLAALPANATMPNVVYILADDMGHGDVSACNANRRITTPNIERRAEGQRVERKER